MAFCTNCGNKLNDDVQFCTECGTPVDDSNVSTPASNNDAPAAFVPATSTARSRDAEKSAPVSKNVIIGIVIAVVVIILAVVVFVVLGTKPTEKVEVKETIKEETVETKSNVSIPVLEGLSEDSAKAVLKALGLPCEVEYIDDKEKLVLEQSPESGKEVPADTKVTIKVGNGKSSVTSEMGKARTVKLTVTNPRNGQVVTSDIKLDSNDEVIPDLLTRKYTADEIRALGLSDAELYIARNSIVAKSGYIFHYEPNTQFFIDNCAWYKPTSSEYDLGGIGGANAGVIREVEASHDSWYLEIK